MGIAAEIAEYLLDTTEWRLGVDDPVFSIESVFEGVPRHRVFERGRSPFHIDVTQFVGTIQCIEKFSTKESAEDFDRQQVTRVSIYPFRSIRGQSAAGDNAVKVRMKEQILSPGVQHRSDADSRAETFFVFREFKQCCGSGIEQDFENRFFVSECEWIQIVGDRKYDMEMRCGKYAFQSFGKPFGPLRSLTFGTVPVATGVVRDP